MKVRVLYPTALAAHCDGEEPEAGSIINLDNDIAEALIADNAVEPENAKPSDHPQAEALGHVEAATSAPGQKRQARKPAAKK